jgi:hypothetical protein
MGETQSLIQRLRKLSEKNLAISRRTRSTARFITRIRPCRTGARAPNNGLAQADACVLRALGKYYIGT